MRTIAFRLTLAFMCIIVFLVLQGVFAYLGFTKIETVYRNAFSHEQEMALLRADLMETRLQMVRFISTLDPEKMDFHRQIVENNLTRLHGMLAKHGVDPALTTKNAELYATIINLHGDFFTKTARRLLNTESDQLHGTLLNALQQHGNIMETRLKNDIAAAREKTIFINFGLLAAALLTAGLWALILANTVTDRRKSERTLQASESRLRAIFNAAENIAFVISDARGSDPEVIEFSPGAEKIFNYQKSEIIGRPVSVLHVEADVKKFPEVHAKMRNGKIGFSGEITQIRKSGEPFPALFATYPLFDANGAMTAVLSVSIDISNQKTLEARLQQAHKMEAIGTLAGGIAHDFNNILTIIIGNTELAMENFPTAHPVRKNLKEILTAGLRARDVVRQLLSYSRKSAVHKQPLDMGNLIEANQSLIRSSIPATIDIHYQIAPSLPPVAADKTQMYQVLLNLTTNAAAAMEDKGGRLDIELSRVRIADADRNNPYGLAPGKYVSLAVRDTGCGIPATIRDRIFDPYFTTKEAGKGSGMGLAVVHGIVEYHEGGIHVESAPGKGTEIRILLPEAGEEITLPDPGGLAAALGSGRILFVDDEPAIADANRQLLERRGYHVQAFTDPEPAIQVFSENPNAFDVIISDMTMPKMTGDQLAAEIKKLRPEIPVILCTGYSERMDAQKAKTLGISAFLTKPVAIKKMTQTIGEVMKENDE